MIWILQMTYGFIDGQKTAEMVILLWYNNFWKILKMFTSPTESIEDEEISITLYNYIHHLGYRVGIYLFKRSNTYTYFIQNIQHTANQITGKKLQCPGFAFNGHRLTDQFK
jgi:hypothetical protein